MPRAAGEGCELLLQPAPAATRSCLQHYFDAHRRHSESTSALALVVCVASSDWFRLTRYFRDHVVWFLTLPTATSWCTQCLSLCRQGYTLTITTLLGGRRSRRGSYPSPLHPTSECRRTHPHHTSCCCGVESLTSLAPSLRLHRCFHLASLPVLRGGKV